MLKNYLKIAIRNLWRRQAFSFINITGLAIGMASAALILLWIHNELSYDQFHRNKDSIYEVWNRGVFDGDLQCWDNTPKILGPSLQQGYPQIARVARTDSRWYVTRVGEKKLSSKALITDPAFLSMFSFPLLQGNPTTVLSNLYSIVITQKMATKMFGSEPAMGKTIRIDMDVFTVTGILKDLPTNSSFDFEYLLPWAYKTKTGQDDNNWGNNSVNTFIQLQPGNTELAVDALIKNVSQKLSNGEVKEELFLHPLSKWHLYDNFENGKIAGGRIEQVRMFGVIAVFILLIACINFMNLSTARSEQRAKEVGIRKVSGASRGLLISQFLGESMLIACIAGILAFVLVSLSLPGFDNLTGKALVIPFDSAWFWLSALGFVIVAGVVAGSYPAFFISSYKPVAVLKGSFKRAQARLNPRKILVVLQFSFAIILIICTIIVVRQIRFAQERETGYKGSRLAYHWNTGDLIMNYPMLKSELLASGAVDDVTSTSSPLTTRFSDTWGLQWEGKDPNDKTDFDRFSEDQGLVKTAGLQLIQGRDIDLTKYATDSTAMLLNESAVKAMKFSNPIGQIVKDDIQYHVVGVIKDFVLGSPYDPTRPMVIEGAKGAYFNVVNMKLSARGHTGESLNTIGLLFKKYNPDYPFEYHFVDQDYAIKFDDTQRIATLTGLFAGLAIFISCLGLFGLAAFMAESRIKEIGVRKVLGASIFKITTLLSREFLTLVFISILIASPIAWYIMHSWLQGYAYRIEIPWWVFILAGGLSIAISLATVSYQTIKAAIANPIKNLRTE